MKIYEREKKSFTEFSLTSELFLDIVVVSVIESASLLLQSSESVCWYWLRCYTLSCFMIFIMQGRKMGNWELATTSDTFWREMFFLLFYVCLCCFVNFSNNKKGEYEELVWQVNFLHNRRGCSFFLRWKLNDELITKEKKSPLSK